MRRLSSPLRLLVAVATVAALVVAVRASDTPKTPELLKGLKYRLLGPAWGGRVTRAAGVPVRSSWPEMRSISGQTAAQAARQRPRGDL